MKTIQTTLVIALITLISVTANAQMSDYKFSQLFNQAFELIVDGENERALPILERLYESDPKHAQVQFLLAASLIKTGDRKELTTVLLEKAVKNYSFYHQSGRVEDRTAPVRAWLYLAMSYASMYEYDKAIESYRNYMSCIPLASLDHKREIIEQIKKLKSQRLADRSTGVTSLLAGL